MDVNVTMIMMPKAQPRWAELNLGDSVLGEIEKDSFIIVPGKGGLSRLLPQETMCPKPRGSPDPGGFITNVQGWGLWQDQGVYPACTLFISSPVMGLFSLASAVFLVAFPLISNYLNLPLGKVMEAGVLPVRNRGQK